MCKLNVKVTGSIIKTATNKTPDRNEVAKRPSAALGACEGSSQLDRLVFGNAHTASSAFPSLVCLAIPQRLLELLVGIMIQWFEEHLERPIFGLVMGGVMHPYRLAPLFNEPAVDVVEMRKGREPR